MKKYNLSKIMKRAWEVVRKTKMKFATALKFSWTIAKKEKELKEKWDEEDGIVTWNIWSGYGHIRAYYKCDWMCKYQNNKKNHFVEVC